MSGARSGVRAPAQLRVSEAWEVVARKAGYTTCKLQLNGSATKIAVVEAKVAAAEEEKPNANAAR